MADIDIDANKNGGAEAPHHLNFLLLFLNSEATFLGFGGQLYLHILNFGPEGIDP
jgi:hypothetical protein